MNIKPILKGLWNWSKKNAPRILAGSAIISNILGYWFMHREAPIVKEKLKALPKDATIWTKIKTAGPTYLPAFMMLLVSSGCTIGGLAVGERKAAMLEQKAALLASLYSTSETAAKRIETQMMDKLGPEKAQEVHDAVANELMKEHPLNPDEVEYTGKGNTLFYEPLAGRYFRSDLAAVKNDCSDFKDYVKQKCEGSVNDWYEHLGIRPGWLGDIVGWNIDREFSPYFDEASTSNTRELCWVIRHINNPVIWTGKEPKNFHESSSCYPYD